MRRNLDEFITELDGSGIKIQPEKDEDGKPVEKFYPYGANGSQPEYVTIGYAISSVLSKNAPDGSNAKKNVTAYKVARKLRRGGVQELDNDEIALIREICGKMYISLYYGQIEEWCEKDYIDPAIARKPKDEEPTPTESVPSEKKRYKPEPSYLLPEKPPSSKV